MPLAEAGEFVSDAPGWTEDRGLEIEGKWRFAISKVLQGSRGQYRYLHPVSGSKNPCPE